VNIRYKYERWKKVVKDHVKWFDLLLEMFDLKVSLTDSYLLPLSIKFNAGMCIYFEQKVHIIYCFYIL
jgi:hypothetical protein